MKHFVALLLKLFMSGALLVATAWTQTESGWQIDTIAGTGKPGHGGDGSRAVEAQIDFPVGVAVDNAGNLYIAEHYSQRIRRVDPAGTIDTIAGTGEPGYGGDGGRSIEAQLLFPSGVAVDKGGNLYIADTGNHRIRRVDTSGIITTIAGTGESGFDWDGPAIEAQLSKPRGVAVDNAGNLYIAGNYSFGIRRIDPTGIMSEIANSHEPFDDPSDSPGRRHSGGQGRKCLHRQYLQRPRPASGFHADRKYHCGHHGAGLRWDGGLAVEAQINYPAGVAVDGSGNLYIADSGNHRIRRVDPSGTITTIAGTGEAGYGGDGGPAAKAQLASPLLWRWTARANSTLRISATTGSGS